MSSTVTIKYGSLYREQMQIGYGGWSTVFELRQKKKDQDNEKDIEQRIRNKESRIKNKESRTKNQEQRIKECRLRRTSKYRWEQ